MKLFLSSYGLGNHADQLKKLVGKVNGKVAVCVNALDAASDHARTAESVQKELANMESLGFTAEQLDLRDYFGNDNLAEKMKEYDMVWVRGGNTFILAKAFRQSGFDKLFQTQIKDETLVYAGYSAAFCVLSKDLHGVELVDDKDASATGYKPGEIWDGMGIIDFHPIVHFRSNHNESDDVEREYRYVLKNKIPHITLKDGDVYLVDGPEQRILR